MLIYCGLILCALDVCISNGRREAEDARVRAELKAQALASRAGPAGGPGGEQGSKRQDEAAAKSRLSAQAERAKKDREDLLAKPVFFFFPSSLLPVFPTVSNLCSVAGFWWWGWLLLHVCVYLESHAFCATLCVGLVLSAIDMKTGAAR